ncbi:GNAT family N-acetyltransferase [Pseudoroseicyclus aestuarii]|uniref:RimJ/RimL family protein N-acetyltransferase n=1 Tax=Pseudoroseicyclus aestuarii TaxID=1795041 RepID=A0A318T8Y7_9RHOB|nr:GNAT family N-acetyltransferase [Pseudoroseicyclus aestuarii]PYE84828.1 RimJ/RimL family protein N-acetyltransferase [Pseudoroseicyclus aestuarii]
MTDLSLRRNRERDLAPLSRLLTDEAELRLVNPSAKFPFDPLEWQEKWLGDLDDESFYLLDAQGQEVGFFALRPGIGPEQRHLAYVFVAEEARGGAGEQVAALVEEAARALRALTVTLKVEADNLPAHAAYVSAGYEEMSRSGDMVTMRLDLD